MRRSIRVVLFLTAIVFGVARGQQPAKQEETPPPPRVDVAEVARGPAAPVDPKAYIIGPEDVLMVRVWREPELSGPVVVRPDGKISLALAGEIQAGGLTPEQLTGRIRDLLEKLIKRPEVLVSVQSVQSKKYLVSGEVNKPGSFPLVVPTTVLEAIVQAGGLREFANKKKIVILRGGKRLFFNYRDVVKGKNLQQNVLLENGDHVIVE